MNLTSVSLRQRKQERCADAVTEALRLIRPLILGDEGREAVAEVLRGAVRQRVNLHAGGECRHRCQTEAVHETLHTQDAEIHDELLNISVRIICFKNPPMRIVKIITMSIQTRWPVMIFLL